MRLIFQRLAAAAALLAAAVVHAAEADRPAFFNVCLDAESPPFSSAATPERGIDVEVAQALAQQLGRTLKPVWVEVPNRGGLGKALRQTLVAGRCDAYLGIPQGLDVARELAERGLVASGPYLTLGYVLVAAPGGAPPATGMLRRAGRIGVVTATPADLYLHRRQLPRAPYAHGAALMAALEAGELDLALVWSPVPAGEAGARLVRGTDAFDDAELTTSLTVATRGADAALSKELAAAVENLRAAGRFDAIAQRHRLPPLAGPASPAPESRVDAAPRPAAARIP